MKGPDYYPMFVNIEGRRCIVIGGGSVALRKAKALLEHGGKVAVVSPELCPELAELAAAGHINAILRNYRPGDLKGAFLAVAATSDRTVNKKVAEDAKAAAVLVNVADDPECSDYVVPSSAHVGGITVAVATDGSSPALARKIRMKLEAELGKEYAELLRLVGEVREEVKRQGIEVSGDDWQAAINLDEMIDALRQGSAEKVKAALLDKLRGRR